MTRTKKNSSVFTMGPSPGCEWVTLPERLLELYEMPLYSLREIWTVPELELVSRDEGSHLKSVDLPWFSSTTIAMRERVAIAIEPLLCDGTELLPARCEGESFFLLHVFNVLDVLDEHKSCVTRFPSTGKIMRVERHVFTPHVIENVNFFKIRQVKSSPIYCSDSVVDWLSENNFTGLKPELVWSHVD